MLFFKTGCVEKMISGLAQTQNGVLGQGGEPGHLIKRCLRKSDSIVIDNALFAYVIVRLVKRGEKLVNAHKSALLVYLVKEVRRNETDGEIARLDLIVI